VSDKLFHVFVSSTYDDLVDERRHVREAISKAGHVPEGMEVFPASSQRQFDFIKRVIQRCDYYVVIVGGRYGSLADDEISYTEREYGYAASLGLPVLAFLHADPTALDAKRIEIDTAKAAKLSAFRGQLESKSLVDYWDSPSQLATKVVAALAQEISSNPRVGWIRGDRAATESVLSELNQLRKRNEDLSRQLAETRPPVIVEGLAGLTDIFEIHYTYHPRTSHTETSSSIKLTWADILRIVGPAFRTWADAGFVEYELARYFREILKREYSSLSFAMTDRRRILTQFELLGLMRGEIKTGNLFHTLTPDGLSQVLSLNAVVRTPQAVAV
jgi:hypothetical protein